MTLARGVPDAVFADRYIIEIVEAAHAWLALQNRTAADGYRDETSRFITTFELDAAARLEAFPAARALLAELRRRGRRTAVVTRNCEQAVRNTFPDIGQHVDVLLARDNVAHFKPDRRHLEAALEALGCPAGRAAMVGDGRMDMQLGKSLGLVCIGVLTGSSDSHTLTDAGADLVLEDVAGLADLI
jgi:phosphoglycolate phosphatase